MKKILKIVLLCLIAFLIVVCSEAVVRYLMFGYSGVLFWLPLCLLIFGLPSFIFNARTLKLYSPREFKHTESLDRHLLGSQTNFVYSDFLWTCNMLFGISNIITGLFFLYVAISRPGGKTLGSDSAYLVLLGFLIMGIWIIVDGWKMKHLYKA